MTQTKVLSDLNAMVWKIEVAAGQRVAAGDTLIVLEAMKMEIPVTAPRDGTVAAILVAEKQMVAEGEALAVLERFAQVQHLVSTVEGILRPEFSHLNALASCFPGGSITGAPKIRAMEIIDRLEPVCRGPYTGALGYLGFNRESQLSIVIRTMLHKGGRAYFQVGAGIVADSDPEAEYLETLAKARGFFEALQFQRGPEIART